MEIRHVVDAGPSSAHANPSGCDWLSSFMMSCERPYLYNNSGSGILIRRWLHTPFFLVTLSPLPGVPWQRGGRYSPDEVRPALHPASQNNEFPSPFSQCMHHDIQLAIKHGLVIQWLMCLVALVKAQGLSWGAQCWRGLRVYIPIMATLLSFPFLLTARHYREDGEDHLQFSNLYDSALFNQRPLFPLWSNALTYTLASPHCEGYREAHEMPRLPL